jgi:outer membrane protein assembly factor BamB
MKTLARLGIGIGVVFASASAVHGQWTQFGGPERNFHCPAGELAATWPEAGPPVAWRRVLGEGYAETVVDGERLYTLYRRDGKEVIACLARDTGATLWEHDYPVVTHTSAQQFGDGPSATPTIAGERLITVGVGIDIHCLDKVSGEVLWSHDIMEEFEIPMPGRGYSPSPLVWENYVILAIGGTDVSLAIDDSPNLGLEGGSIAAFEIETGEMAWVSQNFPGSKASPILIEFEGQPQVVVFMGNELAGIDPEFGDLLWRYPHATDYGFNCSTPVFDGQDTLVCSSSYSSQAEAVQLVATETGIEARKKWGSRRLSIHFTNMLLVDGRLYGVSSMARPGMLTCLDLETGKMLWRSREFSKANLLYAGGPFVILDEDGRLALTTFTDDGPEIHGSLVVTDSHAFTAPTLVGTELYVRDRRFLTRFDLAPEAEGAAFQPEEPELPVEFAMLAGDYETDSEGAEPQRLRVVAADGWLVLELADGERIRLAPSARNERFEFVEDRTSGSTPRTLEFQKTLRGAAGFVLRSPRQAERTYRLADGKD